VSDDRPPLGKPVTDRELLALPHRGPPRESFGDRYFWQAVGLLGLGIVFVPWLLGLPIQFKRAGIIIIVIGLVGWVRQRRTR
jgi:hypothetical protein